MTRIAACSLALSFSTTVATDSFDHDTTSWFKGNTHTHSLWSDGNDFPEMIYAWYRERGYHFLGISDHNILSEGEKWMDLAAIRKRQRAIVRDAVSKCLARFGEDWIQWEERGGKKGIVLKTLGECRAKLEKSGEFLLIPAEEVSNTAKSGPIHINALNPQTLVPAIKDSSATAREVIRDGLDLIEESAVESGNPILAHLNHPNFQWAITAEDLAVVAECRYFEVYNGHPGINHLGDKARPGDEEIWDIANTIRLAEMKSVQLLGVATDDAHTYHGGDVSPGRGWIFVGADTLSTDSIVQAMHEGRFYSSSGVKLRRIQFDEEARSLTLKMEPDPSAEYTTYFIGTRKDYDASAEDTGIGEVFSIETGNEVSFAMPKDALYLRATVASSKRHPNPSFPGRTEQAWVQPVGWRPRGSL